MYAVLLNKTVGTTISFNSFADQYAGVLFYNMAVGDLNGDGMPDLAMQDADFNNNISIFRNTSVPNSFSVAPPITYGIRGRYTALIADLDGDAMPDIATLGDQDNISLLLNTFHSPNIASFKPLKAIAGDTVLISGTKFVGSTSVTFGGLPAASFVVKNDSTIQAVVGAGSSGSVSVKSIKGSSVLQGFSYLLPPPIITSLVPMAAPIGSTVAIKGNYFSANITDNFVFFGAVKATVVAASKTELKVIVPAGVAYEPVTVNAAGLTGYFNLNFTVSFPAVTPSFTTHSFAPAINFPLPDAVWYKAAACDFDGDGKVDLEALTFYPDFLSSGFSVFKNKSKQIGTILLDSNVNYIAGAEPTGICAHDINADGKPDVLVSSINDPISVLLNNSTGGNISFKDKVTFGFRGNEIQVRDLDNDGKGDFILTGRRGIYVYKNVSVGGNVSAVGMSSFDIEVSGQYLNAIHTVVSDFNNDGKPDLIALNEWSKSLLLYANVSTNDSIIFNQLASINLAAYTPQSIAVGDLDGDGAPDLVLGSSNGQWLTVMKNTGVGGAFLFTITSYSTQSLGITNGNAQCIISDLNGDGKADVALACGNKYLLIFENFGLPGALAFRPFVTYEFEEGGMNNILTADFDGDGKMDLVNRALVENTNTVIRIKRNEVFSGGIASFSPTTGGTGTQVFIKGTGFATATAVSFGYTPAYTFTIVSDSLIDATVGTGESGAVSVTSITGTTLLSGFTFLKTTSSPGIEWQRMVGTDEDERALYIQPTQDGGYITAGYTQDADSPYYYSGGDFYVAKLNDAGQVQWQKRYGTDTLVEQAEGVLEDAGGNFLIAGSRTGKGAGKYSTLLVKVSPRGTEIWQKLYPQENDEYYNFQQFTATSDGGYVIVGAFTIGDGSRPYLIVSKFDGAGNKAWQRRFEQGADYITKLVQTLDGGYVMTGRTIYSQHGATDCYVLKLDSNGNMEWERSLGGHNQDIGDCIKQMPDGGYIVAGNTTSIDGDFFGNTATGVWMAKLNTAGYIEWQKIVGEGQLFDVTPLAGGGFVITGGADRYLEQRGRDLWLIQAADDGQIGWQKWIGGKGNDEARSIKELPNGKVIVAGSSDSDDGDVKGGNGNHDFWIVKLGNSTDINVCPTVGAAILQSHVRGSNYRWQVDRGDGFVDIGVADTLYAGAKDSLLRIPQIPSGWNGYKYKCLVDGNDVGWFVITFKNTWVATSNTDWNNTANWSCGAVPDANTDVTINSGNVIISSNAFCRSLTIRPGAIVTVKPGYKLTVTH